MKILFVANWDWVIYNFRLDLARALREEGYEVVLVSPEGRYVEELTKEHGFRWIEWPLKRRTLNPLGELVAIRKLARIYEQEQPEIVHHDTIKPNLYGSIADLLLRRKKSGHRPPVILNSFMGLGFLFSDRKSARLLRPFVLPIMRFAFRRTRVFTTFSNSSDRKRFEDLRLIERGAARLMVSEFVDTTTFAPAIEPGDEDDDGGIVVLMAARLLYDKGVAEFAAAAVELAGKGSAIRMVLAGEPDTDSPGFVPEARLRQWHERGIITWLGKRSDMPGLLKTADVVVLPTYYNEGLPRILVEAAASGLPLIATDIPACRRVVDDGENGFLIPPRNAAAVVDAIEKLASDRSLRMKMGHASRAKALNEFAAHKVVQEWIGLYRDLSRA